MKTNLRKRRDALKLSRLSLGRLAGVSKETIKNLETLPNQNPTLKTVQAIASALNADVNDIFPIGD